MTVKLISYNPIGYIMDVYNIIDGFIVIISLLDLRNFFFFN